MKCLTLYKEKHIISRERSNPYWRTSWIWIHFCSSPVKRSPVYNLFWLSEIQTLHLHKECSRYGPREVRVSRSPSIKGGLKTKIKCNFYLVVGLFWDLTTLQTEHISDSHEKEDQQLSHCFSFTDLLHHKHFDISSTAVFLDYGGARLCWSYMPPPDTCLNPNLHGPTRNYISSLVFEDSQAQ